MHVLGKADEREVTLVFASAYFLGNLMTALKYLFAICTTNINLFFSNITHYSGKFEFASLNY